VAETREPIGCFGAILALFGIRGMKRAGEPGPLPYRLRDDFLSPAERSLFGVLQSVVGESGVICPKVRVADLLFVVDRKANMGHANRIDRKHVDFVVCAPDTMTPKVVVELDDASHARADRQERDELLDKAFQAAGLPVLHVVAKRHYTPAELAAQILPFLVAAPAIDDPVKVASHTSSPSCPKCGSEMVLRTASKGDRAGERFFGCKSYPQCRTVVPITD